MSDYDKSLEDIIKERKFVKKPRTKNPSSGLLSAKAQKQAGGRIQKTAGGIVIKRLQISRQNPQMRSNVMNAGGQGHAVRLMDARSKIIQKQRVQVRDAREMLSKKSPRITDVRQKLNVNAQRKRVKWTTAAGDEERDGYYDALESTTTPDQLTRTVKNIRLGANLARNHQKLNDRHKHVVFTKGGLTVIRNRLPGQKGSVESAGSALFARTFGALMKETSRGPNVTAKRQTNSIRVPAMKRKYSDDEGDYEDDIDDDLVEYAPTQNVKKPIAGRYSKVATMATAPNATASPNISRGLQMRLGGTEGGPVAAANDAEGYKIRVTNLHPKVTHEDIKELFGDVGVLRSVLLYKQGIADVVYAKLADAKKAIDNYHDRELDGQPMICKFVNPPAETVRESRLSKYLKTGTLHSDRIPCAGGLIGTAGPATTKSRIKPDVSVIHTALFHRNASRQMAANRNASITVTM